MFNIKLIDIGGDGLVTEIDTEVETLNEAEMLAGSEISVHLDVVEVKLVHEHDLIYDVYVDEQVVGSIAIRSL